MILLFGLTKCIYSNFVNNGYYSVDFVGSRNKINFLNDIIWDRKVYSVKVKKCPTV